MKNYLDYFIPKYQNAPGPLPEIEERNGIYYINGQVVGEKPMSGTDPIGQLWVEGAVLGKPFELGLKGLGLLGKAGWKGLSKVAPKMTRDVETGVNAAGETVSKGIQKGKETVKQLFRKSNKPIIEVGNKVSISNPTGGSADNIENIYWQRAKAKGITPEEADVVVVNGNNPLEAETVLDRIAQKGASSAKPGTKEYAEDIQILREEFPAIVAGDAGRGWQEYKLVHFNPEHPYSKQAPGLVKMHEVEHAVHFPAEPIPKGALAESELRSASGIVPEYFFDKNSTEVGARISQIWNKLGIKDASKFTGQQLKQQFEKYLNNLDVFDNEISMLYNHVIDWDKLASWASNPRNVYGITGITTIGSGILKSANDNDKQNYLYYFQ